MIRKIMKQMDPNAQAEEAEVYVVTILLWCSV
jgi:hypothetical protein